jgi:TrfA protein
MATTKSSKPTTKAAATMAKIHQLAAEATERLKAKEAADKRAAAKAKREAQKTTAAKQAQLPLWPEAVRAVPNAVLRGALFSVSKERETFAKRTLIASVSDLEIRFLGTRFNQLDLDLWEMLMHIARLQPLGAEIRFTAHAILKALGRGTGGKDHEELKEQMARLAGGLSEITWVKDRKTFVGTLISSYYRDEDTGEYVVKFNKDFGKLYAKGHTSIDWEQRQSLGQNNLAKWLHGFYSSHELQVYPYKVETLQRLCGSTTTRKEFRRLLREALPKLVKLGTLTSWEIDAKTDLVSVAKSKFERSKNGT